MTTIVLADDHHLVRKSFRMLLEAETGFRVVGEAADGREALQLVESKRPTVLLLDLAIPHVHGLDVIRQVTEQTNTQVVVVSMHRAPSYVVEALSNGALGYVLKHSMPGELLQAVREAAVGRKYLSSELPQEEITRSVKCRAQSGNDVDPLNILTRREKVILQLAAQGKNNTEIAKELSLSPRTIESHRASLMCKLRLRSQTEIVLFALRKNLISI